MLLPICNFEAMTKTAFAPFASTSTGVSGAPPRETSFPTTLASSPNHPVRNALRQKLLSLSFHAFASVIGDLLRELGYEEVRHAGRFSWKGRNSEGGYDLCAFLHVGLNRRRVIVQVKQFDATAPLYQRTVDELRGVSLRVGAAEALLITIGRFSESVEMQRRTSEPGDALIAPVQLIGGEELLDQLIDQRVGVVKEQGELVIDESYFQMLIAFCAARENRRERVDKRDKPRSSTPESPSPQGMTLTLRFEGFPNLTQPRVISHR